MYIKLKGEDYYHFCEECIEEKLNLNTFNDIDRDLVDDSLLSKEERGGVKLCNECEKRAKAGKCTPPYIKEI